LDDPQVQESWRTLRQDLGDQGLKLVLRLFDVAERTLNLSCLSRESGLRIGGREWKLTTLCCPTNRRQGCPRVKSKCRRDRRSGFGFHRPHNRGLSPLCPRAVVLLFGCVAARRASPGRPPVAGPGRPAGAGADAAFAGAAAPRVWRHAGARAPRLAGGPRPPRVAP
jgi:hypothetical protein